MKIELLQDHLHLTIREIAKALNTSPTNVRYWLKKHGLSVNRPSGPRMKRQPDIDGKKQCTSCLEHKEPDEYYAQSTPGKLHSQCKKCISNNTVERQRAFKAKCVAYKGGRCEICGYDKYQGSFDFHHLDPAEKDFSLAKVKLLTFDQTITDELDKCALLCANCHREVHGGVSEIGGPGEVRTHTSLD